MNITGHTLVVGKTGYGKTRIVKHFCRVMVKKKGIPLMVLTPSPLDQDLEWKELTDFRTGDTGQFHQWVFEHQNCVLVVDEAGDLIGRCGGIMNQIATKGRHWGHAAFFITQRATMVDINTRTQCSNLFLFCSSAYDCAALNNDFVDDVLLEGPKLKRGEVILKISDRDAFKTRVF